MASNNGEGHVEELDDSQEIDGEDLVTLVDEDGNEHEFVVLAVVELEGDQFAMLSPVDQVEDEETEELELFLFTYEETDEGYVNFGEIEDDDVYQAVQEYCATLLETDADEDEEEGDDESPPSTEA